MWTHPEEQSAARTCAVCEWLVVVQLVRDFTGVRKVSFAEAVTVFLRTNETDKWTNIRGTSQAHLAQTDFIIFMP
jgi:hypothetical protein